MKAYPSISFDSLGQITTLKEGMDLRDYFAAKAMQSYCGDKEIDKNTSFAVIAIMSYEMANAMMEARKQ